MRTLLRLLGIFIFLGIFIYQAFFAYGNEIDFGNGHSVYYAKGATKEEAQKLGDALTDLGYFGTNPASVQVAREGETYLLRFVTVDTAWSDPQMQKNFAVMGHSLAQQAFPGQKVRIEMCDDGFETKSAFAPQEPVLEDGESTEHGNVAAFGQNNVYYKVGITPDEAQKTGKALEEMGFFADGSVDVQLLKDGEVYVVKFITSDSVWTDSEMQQNFAIVGWGVAESAFPQKDVRIELTDDQLQTKVTLKPQEPPEEK